MPAIECSISRLAILMRRTLMLSMLFGYLGTRSQLLTSVGNIRSHISNPQILKKGEQNKCLGTGEAGDIGPPVVDQLTVTRLRVPGCCGGPQICAGFTV
ncbi:hypothetical protein EV426DRAFT_585210 [Tirmania nivea]|nr:hypothetical protein EV426DRAFT_585210 [Tirmania nivea]